MKKLALNIAIDHPAGAGHFPGNPIIPGAWLLAEVLRSIGAAEGISIASCHVKSAKFQHPARPGDNVEVEYEYSSLGAIDFKCVVAGNMVLTGAIGATGHA